MLDFDGVIADLQGAMVRSCNERFGTRFTVESLTDWNWWFRQPKHFSDFVWKECYPDKEWFLNNVTDYIGAGIAINWLRDRGDYAAIVTARPQAHREMLEQWLQDWGIDLPLYIVGSDPKSGYCQKLQLDTVVEDGAHNLRPMSPAKQTLFLVDRPWNQHELLPGVTRVPSLSEAVALTTPEEEAA
jgi:hypothetical protein